jgi:hypothetical protein
VKENKVCAFFFLLVDLAKAEFELTRVGIPTKVNLCQQLNWKDRAA